MNAILLNFDISDDSIHWNGKKSVALKKAGFNRAQVSERIISQKKYLSLSEL